jgi:methyl-accepting chemotaxis protein
MNREELHTNFDQTILRLSRGYKKSTVFSSVTSHTMDIIEENVTTIGGAMQNILAALEELQATSGSTARNTTRINSQLLELVENNRGMAEDVVRRVQEIQQVKNDAGYIDNLFKELNAHSKSIQKLTGLIEDVSESIHVLSINTSIEAAHIGREAAGFEVIAGEIKKLAAKTSGFSKEISNTMEEFKLSIGKISEKLEVFMKLIRAMHSDMNRFGSQFEEYEKTLSETGDQLAEITGAVNEGDLALKDGLNSLNSVSSLLSDMQSVTTTLNSVHGYLEQLFDSRD